MDSCVIASDRWDFTITISYDEHDVIPPYPLSAQLIAKNLLVIPGEVVLDLGTGTGIQAIVAKKLGASHVVATDIDETALCYAKINGEHNGVAIEFLVSDLFAKLTGRRFDLIVANPPMFASATPLKCDIYGGETGRDILDRVILEAPGYLQQRGRLVVPTESYLGLAVTERLLDEAGFRWRKIAYGEAPCGLQMMRDLHFNALLGHLQKRYGIDYFSSTVFEAELYR